MSSNLQRHLCAYGTNEIFTIYKGCTLVNPNQATDAVPFTDFQRVTPQEVIDSMKSLLPLRRTHIKICTTLNLPYDQISNVSTIFEDNRAALLLATTDPPRLTPRSKSIAVKYHWFREHLKSDSIVMKSIDSAHNRANILTKPLAWRDFIMERKMTMGF